MSGPLIDIATGLDKIDPYDFEKLVANIWENEGWNTTVTSGSGDRGIDIIAELKTPINLKALIQAKAYSLNNKIGSGEIRKYATLYEQESEVDVVIIVTTGFFTDEAKKLADNLDVRVVNRDTLLNLIGSLNTQSLMCILSPFDSQEHDLDSIPVRSSTKKKCPECDENGTIWNATLKGGNQILICESCEATWQSKQTGTWELIESSSKV